MRLFLVAGKAGSGKNEVAIFIKEILKNTVITSFSKYIKLYTLELTDWDGRDISKPRAELQHMGDRLRAIDKDFLTKRLLEDIEVYKREGISNVVISDVRLVNEVEFFKKIKDIEVVTIRVNSDTSRRNLTNDEKYHITEIELDNYNGFDYTVKNQFNENLKEEIIKILEGMK
jgi:hypothetical protein